MYYAICSSCLEEALLNTNIYHSFLSLIVNNKTPYKVINDSNGKILESYKEVLKKDNIGLLNIWCEDIINNKKIEKVKISENLSENIYINTLINFHKTRIWITNDDSKINIYKQILSDHSITVNSPDEISHLINSTHKLIEFDYMELTKKIVQQLSIMMDRKQSIKIEDLHNDSLSIALESFGYQVLDQTRRGKTPNSNNPGELDILLKDEKGTKLSIIEALREKSCGINNNNIAEHLNKLLNCYDTCGLKINYIVVYCEAKNFNNFWISYKKYINNINKNKCFSNSIPQKSFVDTDDEISSFSDIRVGRGIYERNGRNIEVYHIVCNMYI